MILCKENIIEEEEATPDDQQAASGNFFAQIRLVYTFYQLQRFSKVPSNNKAQVFVTNWSQLRPYIEQLDQANGGVVHQLSLHRQYLVMKTGIEPFVFFLQTLVSVVFLLHRKCLDWMLSSSKWKIPTPKFKCVKSALNFVYWSIMNLWLKYWISILFSFLFQFQLSSYSND